MTKLEQLKSEYARLKGEKIFNRFTEKFACEKAIECDEKMKIIAKEINAIEENNINEKLLKNALFIKEYCERTSCLNCMFYSSEGMYEECALSGKNPTRWNRIK